MKFEVYALSISKGYILKYSGNNWLKMIYAIFTLKKSFARIKLEYRS